MAYHHGVYNIEQDTSLTTPIQGSAGLQVIFGVAPIHLSKNPKKAANTPMLCYSFKECQEAVGYSDDFKKFSLCQSIDACFRVFNVAPIILVNVLDPTKSTHTTINAAEDCAVLDGMISYNKEYVMLDTLEVKNNSTLLAAGSDYTAAHAEDGTEVLLDQQQASDVLNANGVITAINANGFKLWGNNMAAYPSTTDPKDRWLAVRRFFDWDGNSFIRTYMQKVDKPGNKRLIQSIVDSQNIIGNGYVARDYCAGYRVEFRSDENPVTNLLNGHLTVHTFLAPYIPAEYIENIREYDVDALQAAFGGN